MLTPCCIVPVGKRRDGKMRYWCTEHHAPANGPGGVRLEQCLDALRAPISLSETITLSPKEYPGGVALWGAVPAVYSTAKHNMPDIGIHVHARRVVGGAKQIDRTYRKVIIINDINGKSIEINDIDAVYYMVSLVLNKKMKYVECTVCGYPHLDKDWFSVHMHKKHLCAGCGRNFSDTEPGIGNPLINVKQQLDDPEIHRVTVPAGRSINITQAEFIGGIELWGSNQAIVWTAPKHEEHGIHVHCYKEDMLKPAIDDTFDEVIIDGIVIDGEQLRTLMAQQSMPHIEGRVVSLQCPHCQSMHFDRGDNAFTPHIEHHCDNCGRKFQNGGRLKKTISNPMIDVIDRLSINAVNNVKKSHTNMRKETL